jgi:hypothetical protein
MDLTAQEVMHDTTGLLPMCDLLAHDEADRTVRLFIPEVLPPPGNSCLLIAARDDRCPVQQATAAGTDDRRSPVLASGTVAGSAARVSGATTCLLV